jgi:hypothetical protein
MSRGSKSASRNCVRKDGADRTAKSAEMPTLGRLIADPTGVEGFTFVRSVHVVWEEADSKQHRHHVDRRRRQLRAAIAVRKLGVMEEAGHRPTSRRQKATGDSCGRASPREISLACKSRQLGYRLQSSGPLENRFLKRHRAIINRGILLRILSTPSSAGGNDLRDSDHLPPTKSETPGRGRHSTKPRCQRTAAC